MFLKTCFLAVACTGSLAMFFQPRIEYIRVAEPHYVIRAVQPITATEPDGVVILKEPMTDKEVETRYGHIVEDRIRKNCEDRGWEIEPGSLKLLPDGRYSVATKTGEKYVIYLASFGTVASVSEVERYNQFGPPKHVSEKISSPYKFEVEEGLKQLNRIMPSHRKLDL